MKIVLTTLNARFIYSTLALYELRSFCQNLSEEFLIKEYTINEMVLDIAADLHREKADLIAFSCYIWNIEPILEICSVLKKVNPELFIVLGGPEVSYDPGEVLNNHSFIDCIVVGEGEETFYQLVESKARGLSVEEIPGLVWRKSNQIVKNPPRPLIKELDCLPFPFTKEDLTHFAGKIVYYEASRGCPFNCQYCLSSTIHGVRFFSLERVKSDLKKLIDAKVKQVKFVDRTFNCHLGRTKEILAFLLKFKDREINFHFEITADLLDEEIIDLMGEAPAGFFQVETGIQSTNPQVLEIIKRKMDFQKVSASVERLRYKGNVHLHLDLIAGLPGEDMISFEKSFNEVYLLRPDNLQLGFLKLLKGSGLRNRAEELGLVFHDHPPYEILMTKEMSFADLSELKEIEDILEQYHNSGRYKHTLNYVIHKKKANPFLFFRNLACFWRRTTQEKMLRQEAKFQLLYRYLLETFPEENELLFIDFLKLDWLLTERRNTLPMWLGGGKSQDRSINLSEYLPWARGMTPKEIYKKIAVVNFHHYFFLKEGMVKDFQKKECRGIIDYTERDTRIIFV
ncbi:MAG: DUF4080 domain-containing protein [Bacillota bacterium]|jgi:radical SAM superfamily enzyme YgiQ (UPF0313 family)